MKLDIIKWRDFSDEELQDLKTRIRTSGGGLHWVEEIAKELEERPVRRARSEALAKEFDDVAKQALDKLKSKRRS